MTTLNVTALRFLTLLPKERRPYARLKVWVDGAEWRASVSAASGGTGGIGPTPEAALDAAVDNWEHQEARNG